MLKGYRARVERHSVDVHNPKSECLTVVIRFPRMVLAETATHRLGSDNNDDFEIIWRERTTTRDISKNSASSRAIPLSRMIEQVWNDPYVPEAFSIAGPGMQANGYMDGADQKQAEGIWLEARDDAIFRALSLCTDIGREKIFADLGAYFTNRFAEGPFKKNRVGVHKEMVNRLLEPWMWTTQVVTMAGHGISNFFALRCDKMAHPAFRTISRMAYLAYRKSKPEELRYGRWHLPFVPLEEQRKFRFVPDLQRLKFNQEYPDMPDLIQFSAARCAWISYENHDKDGTPEAMKGTFAKLLGGWPKHGSPVEHQATPYNRFEMNKIESNLSGWLQARKLIEEEVITHYEPTQEEINSWGITGPLWPAE